MGRNLKNMQIRLGACIKVVPQLPGDSPTRRKLKIYGSQEQIDAAKQLMDEVQSEPGSGYMQPGRYPGPPSQQNTSQPQYGGNSPQTTSGWDLSDSPTSGCCDYYIQQNSQQQQPVPTSLAPGDHKTSYNSGQTPATAYGMQGFYAETSFAHPPSAQQHYYTYGLDGCGGYAAPSLQPFFPPSNAIELRST